MTPRETSALPSGRVRIATCDLQGHCRAAFALVPSSRWPIEMNIGERDAARAVGTALDEPQPKAAPPSERQSRNLKPLLSLAPYIARYRWRAVAALVALLLAAVATLPVRIGAGRMIVFGFSREGANLTDSYSAVMIAIAAVRGLAGP